MVIERCARLVLALLLFFLVNVAGFGVDIESVRQRALGGEHSASSRDGTEFFSNPASFRAMEDTFQFSALSAFFLQSQEVFNLAHMGPIWRPIDFGPTIRSPVKLLDLAVSGPIELVYVKEGFGLALHTGVGFFTKSSIKGKTSPFFTGEKPLVSSLLVGGGVVSGGYAHRWKLPSVTSQGAVIDAGALVRVGSKALYTHWFRSDPLKPKETLEKLISFRDFHFVMGVLEMSLDLGARIEFWESLSFGISLHDAVGGTIPFAQSEKIAKQLKSKFLFFPRNLSVGIAYTPELYSYRSSLSNPRISFDYRDILEGLFTSDTRDFYHHFSGSAEVTVFDVLDLRFGFRGKGLVGGLGFRINETFFLDISGENRTVWNAGRAFRTVVLGVSFRVSRPN